MKLTAAQMEQYQREGYLFFPALFSSIEVKALKDEVPALYAERRPENVREKGSEAVRTNFRSPPTTTPIAALDAIPASSSRRARYSATTCTSISSRSTARPPSTAMSGNGTRTMGHGSTMTTCPSRAR